MNIQQLAYQGFLALMSLGFIVLGAITLIPASASKMNRLNYFSVCSWAPYSTIILLVFSAVCVVLLYKARLT